MQLAPAVRYLPRIDAFAYVQKICCSKIADSALRGIDQNATKSVRWSTFPRIRQQLNHGCAGEKVIPTCGTPVYDGPERDV